MTNTTPTEQEPDWLDEVLSKLDLYKLTPKEAKAAITAHIQATVEEAMFRERSHVIHDAQNRMYDLNRAKADSYFDGFDPHDGMKRTLQLTATPHEEKTNG